MKKIFLISCVSKKQDIKSKASELYTSPLFKLNYKYAMTQTPDAIYILSAEYGLVKTDEEIAPYDKTLNKMKSSEIKIWASQILDSLKKLENVNQCEFVILAGEKYRRYITSELPNHTIPLEGLGIGKQLQKLNALIDAESSVA
ncbi:TPA: DUF6884 domain-containing protein [Vibrio vulnificus]|nr:hypothetical protein [Vibrio vulnificus]